MIETIEDKLTKTIFNRKAVLEDYRLAYQSRQVSLVGRREVLSGKAKFGIFGDGKELAQIAMAKVFQPGDFRSGYYRDQTLIFALGMSTFQEFFAQLYAHADVVADPNSAGRQMNAHFATRLLDDNGKWKRQVDMFNTSADLSPTASQMPRLVGLSYASLLYRELEELQKFSDFSNNGNEIAFGTIGNASCAEGMFWESINAIGVLRGPMVLSIWDDGYGISVPNEDQVTKSDISELLKGFQREDESSAGFDVYTVRGWDYPKLISTYRQAAETARSAHVPVIIHVQEMTQPQGHSTSGSQERYKTVERLNWEREHDCLLKMRQWLLEQELSTEIELEQVENESKELIEEIRKDAWELFINPVRREIQTVVDIFDSACLTNEQSKELKIIKQRLLRVPVPHHRSVISAIHQALILLREDKSDCRSRLIKVKQKLELDGRERYTTHLFSLSFESVLEIEEVSPVFSPDSPLVSGYEILNACFDAMLSRDPRVIAFGEDLGRLGDVNQGFAGLQKKYGQLRVSDTGIREITIVGQAIGLALRGLRPIAELQYLDYLLYALQLISDDLASLHWRTRGGQKAPVILRTRGHRLEGIWHSGSQMAGIIGLIRGVHLLVPRDMTQAAGFYNTLLLSEEPGIVIEVLNGYRFKERLPDNIGQISLPLGVPEVLRQGEDLTLVTYGALCRIALEAAESLSQVGIDAEVIDVRSLLPFDKRGIIIESLKKTGHILFVDEDVPGGATAYMMQEVLETQGGFWWLDSEPKTLTAQEHRPAYGSDGDFWSKPNAVEIFETAYEIMHEVNPVLYPTYYK